MKPNSMDEAARRERADGQSQFDYLRRISDDIQSRDRELRQRHRGKITAIGILGSDVYDKLLILQALRPDFPESLFFTTDLDARLFFPQRNLHLTRNLLIASSYELKLRPELQADVPPFRSVYQTSVFVATRLAIRDLWNSGSEDNADTSEFFNRLVKKSSRLFQIGRTGPYSLPTKDDPSAARHAEGDRDSACTTDIRSCQYIQSPVASLFPEPKSGFWSALVLVAVMFLAGAMASSRRVYLFVFERSTATRTQQPALSRDPGVVFGLSIAVLGALCIGGLAASYWHEAWWPSLSSVAVRLRDAWNSIGDWLTDNGSGEPLVWFDGISLWPAIVLRFASLILGAFLIYFTLKMLEKNATATATEMRLERFRSPAFGKKRRKWRAWPKLRSILYICSLCLQPAGVIRLPCPSVLIVTS
jgi:hypothetical protein